jgi:hypothetical protein
LFLLLIILSLLSVCIYYECQGGGIIIATFSAKTNFLF